MDYSSLLEKKNILEQKKSIIDKITISSYEKDFELTFTHNSTAIEGNTLTLIETKVILEDGISIGGKDVWFACFYLPIVRPSKFRTRLI